MKCKDDAAYAECEQDLTLGFYQNGRTYLIWPVEVSVFVVKILCMCVLVRTKDSLKDLRHKFRTNLFERITNKDTNLLI